MEMPSTNRPQPEPPQDKTIQRPHTPFLLKTASSEMDVKPPSIESISKISSVPTKEDYDGHFIAYMAASTTSVETPSDTRLKTNDHVLDRGMDHFASMAVEDLVSCLRSDVQLPTTIQSKPNLAVATTLWSIIVDDSSNSTLETLFPVRLEDFPSIPKLGLALAVPPLTVLENTISVSQSSLVLAFSKSMSAPASLNLLDDKLEDVPRRICFHPRRMVCVTQQYDPGQLWDEDDERKFNDAVVRGKLLRNTWTAGVLYTRSSSSGPGELWDDEDDRRMSYEVSTQIVDECLEALSTFATLSFVSLDTISISDGLGGFHKFFQSSSDVPLAGSTGGDTTMETSGSLESFASTEVLLPQKCADTEFSLFSSHSGGLCICHEVFPGSACVCDPDVSGGATIVELDDDAEPLKQDVRYACPSITALSYSHTGVAQSSTGYQGVGFLHNHSQFSLSFDDIDIKSQNTSPATITTCASTRSSLASFVGLLEFDFETPEKRVVQDQMQVVDMDVEPNTDYISAISFVRLPWSWAPLD